MNEPFLQLYNQELDFIRTSAAQFAKENPATAAHLGLGEQDNQSCKDPDIERLLEGFAFLTANLQQKIKAQFPQLNQHLLEIMYPNFLAPIPSMLIAGVNGNTIHQDALNGGSINKGCTLKINQKLTFRTTQEVTCWPIAIAQARFANTQRELQSFINAPIPKQYQCGFMLELQCQGDTIFSQLNNLDELCFYLHGQDELCNKFYEYLFRLSDGFIFDGLTALSETQPSLFVSHKHLQPVGFTDHEAKLPQQSRTFSGYRLLQEYFNLYQSFRFFRIVGIRQAIHQCQQSTLKILFLFRETIDDPIMHKIQGECFKLHCTPAINLFSQKLDPISLQHKKHQSYLVNADRTRSNDIEIHSLESVTGHQRNNVTTTFYPLYHPLAQQDSQGAFYEIQRKHTKHTAEDSRYRATDLYISLSDPKQAPFAADINHLSITALCTNRDLASSLFNKKQPLAISMLDDKTMEIDALIGPSAPKASPLHGGAHGWQLIHHLNVNYLSILASEQDSADEQAKRVALLKKMLRLYSQGDAVNERKINAIVNVFTKANHYRLPQKGPITYVRGQEVWLTLNEQGFVDGSEFLFGQLLFELFQRYTSAHSLTGLRLFSTQRGELHLWKPQIGYQKPL